MKYETKHLGQNFKLLACIRTGIADIAVLCSEHLSHDVRSTDTFCVTRGGQRPWSIYHPIRARRSRDAWVSQMRDDGNCRSAYLTLPMLLHSATRSSM